MTLPKADGAAPIIARANSPLQRLECMLRSSGVGNPGRRIAAVTLSRGGSAVNEPEGSHIRSRDGRPSAGKPLRIMNFRHFAGAPQSDPLVLRLKCRLGVEPELATIGRVIDC